jgi:ribosomal protein L12E/L44/L45/RPP1/RPP2
LQSSYIEILDITYMESNLEMQVMSGGAGKAEAASASGKRQAAGKGARRGEAREETRGRGDEETEETAKLDDSCS